MAAVKTTHLLIFTRQFASMIRSRLQLVDVLENLAMETPQRRLRTAVEDVSDDVQRGVDLGDALGGFPRIFDEIYVNVVKAGMESGQLDDSLEQMAQYLERMDEVSRKVRGAMSYPIFMLLAFFGVFNGMVFFILPRFEKMFSTFDAELPWPTQTMLSIGDFYSANWHFILGGVVAVIVTFIIWISNAAGRRTWDELKLSLPVIGRIWRMGALSRFLRTLAVQVRNSVPLLDALRLSASASGNVYVEEVIYQIADEIETGAGIAETFRRYDVFSGIVLQMIAAGEEAGILDELLLSAAGYFDSLLNDQIETATGLINPVLTVVIGAGIASMMLAAFLPVLNPPTPGA
ncbi:MAG: type II secretion system F family protein [Alphaproteobacteria bacterium]|jgi:type II secretory pathway component PulF|nr:type II secretion system F family protein [Alphaproteobacteria bacterium]